MTAQESDRPAPEKSATDAQPESRQQSKARYAAWADRLKVEQRERVASTHEPEQPPEPDRSTSSASTDDAEHFDMGQLMRESNEWTAANGAPSDEAT